VADGLTEDLIDALGQVGALHVISPNGVRPYVNRQIPPDSIARALKVGTLVSGSVERSGDVLRVTARLIDAPSGVQLQSRTLEYPFKDLFALQDELAQEVSRFLRERLGQEIFARERRKGTASVTAWELLQQGEASREAARVLYSQGDATAAGRMLDAADSQLVRASALDDSWADPVVLRGWVSLDRIELSETESSDSLTYWYRQGVTQANRGLQLRPQYPPALELRGSLRYRYWLEAESDGTPEGAEADLRAAAVATNPTQARAWGTLSALLQATGQLAEANLLARRAYEADAFLSESPQILFRLYYTSLDLGREPDAIRWCDAGRQRFPDDWRFTFCQLIVLARSTEADPEIGRAWELVRELERLGPDAYLPRWQIVAAAVVHRAGMVDSAQAIIRRARGMAPDDSELDFYEAETRMLLDDREAALRLLERDLKTNPRFRAYMRANTLFRPLWNDPRFQALVREGN
jgi:TolB-like protein